MVNLAAGVSIHSLVAGHFHFFLFSKKHIQLELLHSPVNNLQTELEVPSLHVTKALTEA
jgi:hypothetical protein